MGQFSVTIYGATGSVLSDIQQIGVVPLKPGTYLMRAEDSGGRVSPVSAVATKGVQAVAFALVDSQQADGTLPGTRTDLVVEGSTLRMATAAVVEISETDDDPSGAPVWSD